MKSKANQARSIARTKIVQANKMALRDTLKTSEYLRQLDEIANTVNKDYKTLETEQIQALKLLADINFKRLNKVLPDLKSVDVTTNQGNKHEVYFST